MVNTLLFINPAFYTLFNFHTVDTIYKKLTESPHAHQQSLLPF
jgi:hypothetical protein